jgi:probable phosphoglycerate mutase
MRLCAAKIVAESSFGFKLSFYEREPVINEYIVYADGASRGNPGAASFGTAVFANGKLVKEIYETIGIASNNVAEYRGLIAGLRYVNSIDPQARVEVRMDSKLVCEQMSGRWKINHADMRELSKMARDAHPYTLVEYTWVPRENNSHADSLANKALDGEGAPAPLKKINYLTERVVSSEVPTTIYFVRHGETILTPERKFSGGRGSNPELNEKGRAQAAHAAPEVAARNPEIFIASPMVRTRQTAEIINEKVKLPITFDEEWIEVDFGKWDGLKPSEVQEQFPKEWEMWLARTDFAPDGGESYVDLVLRVEPALNKLVEKYPGKKVLVVTHNVVIRAIAKIVLSAPNDAFFHIDIHPCSITTVKVWPSDGLRALTSLGEVVHQN